MGEIYSHLTLEDRCRLSGLREMHLSVAEMARRLGCHRTTIYREISRNRCVEGYTPDHADRRAWAYRPDSADRRAWAYRPDSADRRAWAYRPDSADRRAWA